MTQIENNIGLSIVNYSLIKKINNGRETIIYIGEKLNPMIKRFDEQVALHYENEDDHIIIKLVDNYNNKLIKSYDSEIDK